MSGSPHTGRRTRRIPYKRDSHVDAEPPQSGINVTPLVDVCLVLLIIFMVVTPMIGRGHDVRLPRLAEPTEHKEGDQVFVAVDDNGVYIDDDLYTSKKDFQSDLDTKVKEAIGKLAASGEGATSGPILFLKGDRETNYGRVRIVLEWIKETESVRDVALVVDKSEG